MGVGQPHAGTSQSAGCHSLLRLTCCPTQAFDACCRLHVFFGCYHNLFRLMAKCGVLQNLLLKEHTHTFVNTGELLHPDHGNGTLPQSACLLISACQAMSKALRHFSGLPASATAGTDPCCNQGVEGNAWFLMPLPRMAAAVAQAEVRPLCRWRCTGAGLPFFSWRQENWRTIPWAEGILHNPSAQPPGQGEARGGPVRLFIGACSKVQIRACSLPLHASVLSEQCKTV